MSRTLRAASLAAMFSATVAAAPASATVTRYEAENYTPTSNSTWAKPSATASGGKFRWLYSNGYLRIPVTTAVKEVQVATSGTPYCAGGPGTGNVEFQINTTPSYWQQDPFSYPGNFFPFNSLGTNTTAGATFTTSTFTLPYGGYTPSSFMHPDPSYIDIRFMNDYAAPDKSCDLNLAVDYVDIVS